MDYLTMSAEQLADAIDAQKLINRSLLSDIEAPHNLQRDVLQLSENAETIEERLTAEITAAYNHYQSLVNSHLGKVLAARQRYHDKKYHLENLRSMYADGCELIEKMQQRLIVIDNGGKIAKAKELQRKLAELQSQLPAHLKGKTLEEIQAAFKAGGAA